MVDVKQIRQDFPILGRKVNEKPLIYLDNAATSQKPNQVIDALVDYYRNHNANVHRGVHTLSDESTELYDQARKTVADFIHADKPEQIIFVKNTTEAMNLVAWSWGMQHVEADDEIIVTELEHHSNLLPWQRLAKRTGAKLIICPVEGNGDLAESQIINLINPKTKLVALTQVSNVLGSIVDVKQLTKKIKQKGNSPVIVMDGAQSVPHMPVWIEDQGVDFMAFSGHKMCGPQGIGALWVEKSRLSELEPFLVGGGMIDQVYADESTFAEMPDRFDAGTPNVAGAVGLAAACDYLSNVGMEAVRQHEIELTQYALEQFEALEAEKLVTVYGLRETAHRAGIITFNINGVHAHDAAQILDRECGIAVRSGHHCNQLLVRKLSVPATVRASFYLYNTMDEIDRLILGIHRVREIISV
jgi:cysteine desulfurase / selenocysteine lyase